MRCDWFFNRLSFSSGKPCFYCIFIVIEILTIKILLLIKTFLLINRLIDHWFSQLQKLHKCDSFSDGAPVKASGFLVPFGSTRNSSHISDVLSRTQTSQPPMTIGPSNVHCRSYLVSYIMAICSIIELNRSSKPNCSRRQLADTLIGKSAYHCPGRWITHGCRLTKPPRAPLR